MSRAELHPVPVAVLDGDGGAPDSAMDAAMEDADPAP
jgi:hypothetical protein